MIGTNKSFQNLSPQRQGSVVTQNILVPVSITTIQGYAYFFTNAFTSTQQLLCFSSLSQ